MRKDIHSIVGDRIREERKRAGLETIAKIAGALRVPVADLFRTVPGPQKDHVYDAARNFAQLIRDKSRDEIRAALAVAKTTLSTISGTVGKRRTTKK